MVGARLSGALAGFIFSKKLLESSQIMTLRRNNKEDCKNGIWISYFLHLILNWRYFFFFCGSTRHPEHTLTISLQQQWVWVNPWTVGATVFILQWLLNKTAHVMTSLAEDGVTAAQHIMAASLTDFMGIWLLEGIVVL